MDPSTFIIAVDCTIEEWLRGQPPCRRRGCAPALSDGAVLTMEVAGEFRGIDAATGLYRYFCRRDAGWFPALPRLHPASPRRRSPTSRSTWRRAPAACASPWQRATHAAPVDT